MHNLNQHITIKFHKNFVKRANTDITLSANIKGLNRSYRSELYQMYDVKSIEFNADGSSKVYFNGVNIIYSAGFELNQSLIFTLVTLDSVSDKKKICALYSKHFRPIQEKIRTQHITEVEPRDFKFQWGMLKPIYLALAAYGTFTIALNEIGLLK